MSSTTSIQPLTLHAHPGPNPWKIALLLTALRVPFTTQVYTTAQLKEPAFLRLNRVGLTPVLEDPNTHVVLAESGAIQDYILEQYDTAHLLSFGNGKDDLQNKYKVKQWMQFQVTTQGPGLQRVFRYTNVVPIPEARKDAVKAFRTVLDVLEHELSGGGKGEAASRAGEAVSKHWLVGTTPTAADLVFVPFHYRISAILGADAPDLPEEYPHVDAWIKRLLEREDCKKVLQDMNDASR